jgi:hypothetical protein
LVIEFGAHAGNDSIKINYLPDTTLVKQWPYVTVSLLSDGLIILTYVIQSHFTPALS